MIASLFVGVLVNDGRGFRIGANNQEFAVWGKLAQEGVDGPANSGGFAVGGEDNGNHWLFSLGIESPSYLNRDVVGAFRRFH